MYCHKFFAILSNSFIFSDSVVRVLVYFWDFLLIRWTGRYQREEDAASAGNWVESAIFNRIGTIQIIISLAWLYISSRWKVHFLIRAEAFGERGKGQEVSLSEIAFIYQKKKKKWFFY